MTRDSTGKPAAWHVELLTCAGVPQHLLTKRVPKQMSHGLITDRRTIEHDIYWSGKTKRPKTTANISPIHGILGD